MRYPKKCEVISVFEKKNRIDNLAEAVINYHTIIYEIKVSNFKFI